MPKRTFQPNNRKRSKKHGFLSRKKHGSKATKKRMLKGRKRISVT